MEVVVECLCGKKYSVDSTTVNEFACQGCKRNLSVPDLELHKQLASLRQAWQDAGDNVKRKAAVAEQAADLRNPHALPLLQAAAQSGVREAVNAALVGLCRYAGAGQELLFGWLRQGALGVTRLVSAFKETGFPEGVDFLCDAIDAGKLKENQISECAAFLGESGQPRALATLKALRRAYPAQAGILDNALAKLAHLDESATEIPENAKLIPGRPSQAAEPARKGCMGVLLFLVLVVALAALSGCDEVKRKEFAGVLGTVGLPPVAGCEVEVYEASRFASLESAQGRIGQGITDSFGRFSIELSEANLGRPLVVVARPTTGATYLDFGAAGNPLVPFDGSRRPWVAVVRQWLGGESTVAVTPLSTLAFESLMRQPSSEVGPGPLRFDDRAVGSCNLAAASSFALVVDPAENLPAPPLGGPFGSRAVRDQEKGFQNTGYTYALLQLAQAANAFVTATTAPADGALDFYEALFDDARDGLLDASHFGVALPFFTQAGAPAVTGIEVDGSSALLQWISSQTLSPADTAIAGASKGGIFAPTVPDLVAGQALSTGTLRPVRVDSYDVQNFPFSGNVELTIRGDGFRHSDAFFIRSNTFTNDYFEVNRNSVGVDGDYLRHSATELRLRLPDFALTTKFVANGLRVATGSDFREVTFELHSRLETTNASRELVLPFAANARVTNRTDLLLISSQVGRLDASGNLHFSGAGNNLRSAATDPGALVPGVDDVYVLRLRVANPAPDAVNGTGLDLTRSTFTQGAATRIADTFGGAAAQRAIIFESAAALTSRQVNLLPGGVAQIDYPFVFLDTAVPADLAQGVPVTIDAVLSGVSQGAGMPTVATNDVAGFTRLSALAPSSPAFTAELAPVAAPVAPGAATAGNSFTVAITLTAAPRSGMTMGDGVVEFVDLTLTYNGQTLLLRLSDSFALTQLGTSVTALRCIEQTSGGAAFPRLLSQIAPSTTLVLTLRARAGTSGTLSLSGTAGLRDAASGARTSQAVGVTNVTITP